LKQHKSQSKSENAVLTCATADFGGNTRPKNYHEFRIMRVVKRRKNIINDHEEFEQAQSDS